MVGTTDTLAHPPLHKPHTKSLKGPWWRLGECDVMSILPQSELGRRNVNFHQYLGRRSTETQMHRQQNWWPCFSFVTKAFCFSFTEFKVSQLKLPIICQGFPLYRIMSLTECSPAVLLVEGPIIHVLYVYIISYRLSQLFWCRRFCQNEHLVKNHMPVKRRVKWSKVLLDLF